MPRNLNVNTISSYTLADPVKINDALAQGYNTTASGIRSHAEGNFTTAVGEYSHAEGYNTRALAVYSHVEGNQTTATGNYWFIPSEEKEYWKFIDGIYTKIAKGKYLLIQSGETYTYKTTDSDNNPIDWWISDTANAKWKIEIFFGPEL